jgi:hypothetical protein
MAKGDFTKGFWVGLGVAAALVVVSFAAGMIKR